VALSVDLTGRRAVVTGAGKGIGREICLELARAGADVFGVSRTPEDLASLGDEIGSLGRRYGACAVDLRGPAEAARIASAAEASLGPVDVLVNNAGVALTAPADRVTEDEWDTTLDVNAKGAFFLAQAIGRGMLARGRGRIVNVTSQAALGGLADHAAYCASKAALTLVTKVLAVEWGPRGVTCNAVAPTVILTPMGERVWGDPAKAAPMLAKIPLGRFGVPADVAAVVVFLASDLAAMINGETISVDGGYSAQ
jgi:NAD(P)-dependent dehydrogenase (short-subunit alcohol dehydrogenase family)